MLCARVIAYNHLAVIKARENEVLNQSARAIFDNHQCNFTNKIIIGTHTHKCINYKKY